MKFVHEQHLVERQKTKVETSSLRTLKILPRNPNESVRLRIPSQVRSELQRSGILDAVHVSCEAGNAQISASVCGDYPPPLCVQDRDKSVRGCIVQGAFLSKGGIVHVKLFGDTTWSKKHRHGIIYSFFIKNFKYRKDVCFMSHETNSIYIHSEVSQISPLTPKPHLLRSKVPINLYTTTYLVHSPTLVTKYTFSRPDLWAICERQFGRQKSPSFSCRSCFQLVIRDVSDVNS